MRERRKHWYEIRAWADGWEIEQDEDLDGCWTKVDHPVFIDAWYYRVVSDSKGWLPWYGGECPVDKNEIVEVKYRNLYFILPKSPAKERTWDLVVVYRIIKEDNSYAELRAAAKDPTKQIVYLPTKSIHEYPYCVGSNFSDAPENYEIRDKPKTKKVKLLAYLTDNSLTLVREGRGILSGWKRVPSEDKEIVIEE